MTDNQPTETEQKCGLIAVIGAPNAGKSTLVNRLVGQKVAIASPKAQTTRARTLGVALHGDAQLVLVDTPGIFDPSRRLDRAMVSAAWAGTEGADVVLLLVDGRAGMTPKLKSLLDKLEGFEGRCWLVINKVDIARKDKLLPFTQALNDRGLFEQIFFVSAQEGEGCDDLLEALTAAIPTAPWLFPEDQVSDVSERLLATEITREQLYLQLREELPYSCAVETELFSERDDGSVEIRQQILCARPTQKGILLGERGSRIKSIGEAARKELSALWERRVHLFLHVKVKPGWDEDRDIYDSIGLDWVE